MGGSKDHHSIDDEPHRQKESFSSDRAEERAARQLARERAERDPDEERAKHSIFDEPTTLPNRSPVLIDRDWPCRNCGYNLRGLNTGHRCPECGVVELYEPPRDGELTYAQWLAEHQGRVSRRRAWLVAGLVPIVGIPLALGCAFLTVEYTGAYNFVVLGPVAAEVLKIAIAYTLIERRSLLIRRTGQIHLMTLGTAGIFAVVQNLVYLLIYFRSSPMELVVYRWFACVPMHGLCTLIATRGLVLIWERAQDEGSPRRSTRVFPYIVAATVLHAIYNLCVFVRGNLGYGF